MACNLGSYLIHGTFHWHCEPNTKSSIGWEEVPSWVLHWDTVFRLAHSPIQAVHNMLCTTLIGECPNLKTVSQSMTHDGIFQITFQSCLL